MTVKVAAAGKPRKTNRVIPAKAGIPFPSGKGIPAFAGMTKEGLVRLGIASMGVSIPTENSEQSNFIAYAMNTMQGAMRGLINVSLLENAERGRAEAGGG